VTAIKDALALREINEGRLYLGFAGHVSDRILGMGDLYCERSVMTTTQLLAVVATIWIAPHLPKTISLTSGLIMLLGAIASNFFG
jgi:hypothetical protein